MNPVVASNNAVRRARDWAYATKRSKAATTDAGRELWDAEADRYADGLAYWAMQQMGGPFHAGPYIVEGGTVRLVDGKPQFRPFVPTY